MAIDPANLKYYAAVSTLGGAINLSSPETSGVVGNEISRISTAERSAGTTRYVKQFLKNENTTDWLDVKVYFTYKTAYSPNTEISFCLAGTKSLLTTASVLSGNATVTASGYISTSADLREEIRPGELLFNSTNDTAAKAKKVTEVASTYIQIEAPYLGTAGASKQISVAPATMATYVAPTSSSDSTSPEIDLLTGGVCGIWKRYVVWDNCPPFSNDWFTIIFEAV